MWPPHCRRRIRDDGCGVLLPVLRHGYARCMHFDLVDRVLELTPERIVTLKQVSMAEEYLQDHFATFPVLPGVMMLEAMVQAGRRPAGDPGPVPLVLGRVR